MKFQLNAHSLQHYQAIFIEHGSEFTADENFFLFLFKLIMVFVIMVFVLIVA